MELNDLIGKITCADCMDILKQLPDKCIDLVLTDPPYGMDYQSGRREIQYNKLNWDENLDCFSGSGTTAIACHRLKRRFICIEKDKDYYESSVKRLEDEQRQLNLF